MIHSALKWLKEISPIKAHTFKCLQTYSLLSHREQDMTGPPYGRRHSYLAVSSSLVLARASVILARLKSRKDLVKDSIGFLRLPC